MLEKLFRRFAAASHHIVDVKAVPMHHFWLVGLARNPIEIFMLTPQATPCSKILLVIHIQSESRFFYAL